MKTASLRASLVLLLSILLTPLTAPAGKGSMDSGGGDPLANEFVFLARKMADSIPTQVTPDLGVSRAQFLSDIAVIEKSLEGKRPLVSFPSGKTITCFSVEKLGCTVAGFISIARDGWLEQTSLFERAQVIAMELFVRLGVSDRYERAKILATRFMNRIDGKTQEKAELDQASTEHCENIICPPRPHGLIYIRPEFVRDRLVGFISWDTPSGIEVCSTQQMFAAMCNRAARRSLPEPKLSPIMTSLSTMGPESRVVIAAHGTNSALPLANLKIVERYSLPIQDMYLKADELIARNIPFRLVPGWIGQVFIEVLEPPPATCAPQN